MMIGKLRHVPRKMIRGVILSAPIVISSCYGLHHKVQPWERVPGDKIHVPVSQPLSIPYGLFLKGDWRVLHPKYLLYVTGTTTLSLIGWLPIEFAELFMGVNSGESDWPSMPFRGADHAYQILDAEYKHVFWTFPERSCP